MEAKREAGVFFLFSLALFVIAVVQWRFQSYFYSVFALGFSISFLGYTIEKDIRRKRIGSYLKLISSF